MPRSFDFGENWLAYSKTALTSERILSSREAFKKLISGIPIEGKTFLDVGFGQGLSSLCAAQLGAQVYGIDINQKNVKAFEVTKRSFEILGSERMDMCVGSILLTEDIKPLQEKQARGFDIVHSWGVLHHTGDMAQAFENCRKLVKKNGAFIVAIYNRHWSSPIWRLIKKFYCSSPKLLQRTLITIFIPIIFLAKFAVTLKNPLKSERGMDFFIDIVDWVGGYPYEYASINDIQALADRHGHEAPRIEKAKVPTGCNEFVFIDRSGG